MKTKTIPSSCVVSLALAYAIGCFFAQSSAADPAPSPTAGILSHLDADAEMLTLVSADSFAEEAAQSIQTLGTLLGGAELDLDAERLVTDLTAALRQNGAFSLTGFGRSILRESDGVYRQKTFWRGGQGSRLWDLAATDAPVPEEFLPESAAFAAASSADPQALWDMIQALAAVFPDAQLDEVIDGLRSSIGLDIPALVGSLRPGVFAVMTLDEDHPLPLPDGPSVKIPAPGLLIGLRANSDALFDRLTFFLPMAGLVPSRETLGDSAVGVRFRLPSAEVPAEVLQPTVRYLRDRKVFLLASNPALADSAMAAAAGKGRLVDSDGFRKLMQGLPDKGGLSWVSPRLGETLRGVLDALADETPELAALRDTMDRAVPPWSASRTTRTDEGLLRITRTSAPPSGAGRILSESLGDYSNIAMLGIAGGLFFPAVSGAIDSANSTKLASQGKNIAIAILAENMMREANNDGTIWPGDAYTIYDDKGSKAKDVSASTYSTSSEYFDDLIENKVVESLTSYGPFSGDGVPLPEDDEMLSSDEAYNVWSCIAVQDGSVAGDAPFLFTRNLQLTDEDIRRVLQPDSEVDSTESWAAKLDPDEEPFGASRVIVVTRGGTVLQIRAKDLTAERFFGDAKFSRPDAVHVLPAH